MSKKGQKALASASIMSLVLTTALTTLPVAAATTGTAVSGSDRIATSIAIAQNAYKTWTGSKTAVIASGADAHLVDALAVAPLAYQKQAPIFLTNGTSQIEDSVIAALKAQGVTTVYVAGGTVTAAADAQLKAAGVTTVTHFAGTDRFDTAKKINTELEAAGAPKAYAVVNTNSSVADALSVAAIAAKQDYEIVLATDKDNVPVDLTGKTVYAIGGSGVLSDALVSKLSATRFGGSDRFATNAEVLKGLDASLDYTTTYVADGTDAHLVDSLPGSVLAGQTGSPIVLVSDTLDSSVSTVLAGKAGKVTTVVPLGGSVSAAAVAAINTAVTPSTLQVLSVSALNGKQVLVKFSRPVDQTSAETKTNYTIDGSTPADAKLQADNQSVILTLTAAITTKTSVTVTAKNVQLAGDSSQVIPLFAQVLTIEDTVKADVASVTASTNGDTASKAVITFTEPIVTPVAIKIDGTSVAATYAPDPTTGVTIATVTTGISLDATKQHTLQVVNLTDPAGNINTLVTKTFNVTVDKAAPVITGVTQYTDGSFKVTFDKDVNTPTTSDITVAYDNLTTATGITINPIDTKNYEVKLNNPSLYGSASSETLTVLFKNTITDTLTNALTAVTKTVTLNKDTVAPSITGVVVNKNAAGDTTGLTVNFNEGISSGSALNVANITVVNANGVIDTTTFGSLVTPTVSDSATSATLNFSTAKTLTGKYTFTFKSGFAKDTAISANALNAYSAVIDFGSSTSSTNWSLPDVAGTINTTTTPGTITVDFGVNAPVKGGAVAGSATDPNNYSINGTILPAGTDITLDGNQRYATIVLPAGFIPADDSSAIITVSNIQKTDGTLMNQFTTALHSVYDNTAPVLQSAALLDSSDIVLTYNEDMEQTLALTPANGEFTINIGGTDTTFTYKVSKVDGYTKKLKLTLDRALTPTELGKTITVTTNTSTTVTDNSTYPVAQTSGTVVTVTK